MKYNLEIASSQSTYLVTSEFDRAFTSSKKKLVICDENVELVTHELLPEYDSWISVEANEQLKTLDACAHLLEKMAEMGINKDYELIAVGGGAVQDAATLVASLYMRGLSWVYVPTTLMSMMDSCIGGKSSINVGRFKNTVGNFYPPRAIYIDPDFTRSLSPKDISCGISEGAKICFAASLGAFDNFVDQITGWRKSGSRQDLLTAIFTPLEKKKWFIEIDEFDKKERKLLNFGHSFGHALEAASGFSIAHGIGILIGMMAALEHSGRNKATERLASFIESEISESKVTGSRYEISQKVFLDALARDKKNSIEYQNLILPDASGRLEVRSFPLLSDTLEKCLTSTKTALTELGFTYEVL